MVAVEVMSATVQAIFYLVGVVLFVFGAGFAYYVEPRLRWAAAVALGLAVITIVPMWNALAAS